MTLAKYREKHALTYTALAKLLEMSVSNTRKLCLGIVKPQRETAGRIEWATGCAVKAATTGKDWK